MTNTTTDKKKLNTNSGRSFSITERNESEPSEGSDWYETGAFVIATKHQTSKVLVAISPVGAPRDRGSKRYSFPYAGVAKPSSMWRAEA